MNRHIPFCFIIVHVIFRIFSLNAFGQIPLDPETVTSETAWEEKEVNSYKSEQICTLYPEGGAQNVFVVFNRNSIYGDSIARYYQSVRAIPENNICGISCDTNEVITRSYYNQFIRNPLRDSLTVRGLQEQIYFIVLIKGIPLKISATDAPAFSQCSVDAELCLLFNDNYNLYGQLSNPYYNEINHFNSYTYPIHSIDKISYLVSRLDAFTVNDVVAMIDRSVNADLSGNGWYLLDDYPSYYYDQMPYTDGILQSDYNTFYDNTATNITQLSQNPVMGYCGHGIHAGAGYPFILSILDLDYLNGAIFNTYESFNGWSFKPERHQSNHNLIGDFIASGGTCGLAHVYEPYASAVANENVLFLRYAEGYLFIEAAYMSMRYLSWQNIVVGDPLCRINILGVPEAPAFTELTNNIIVTDQENSIAAYWADYDNDFDLDLLVLNADPDYPSLYRNDARGNFLKITNVPFVNEISNPLDACWGDYQNDGYIDLLISNKPRNLLYQNTGDNNFIKITTGALVNESSGGEGCIWIDYDSDGFLDAFQVGCSTCYGSPKLYRNDHSGNFTKILSGEIVNDRGSSTCSAGADFDNDGDVDLFVTNAIRNQNCLYLNNNDGTFSRILNSFFLNDVSFSSSCSWGDLNNDLYQDLVVANSQMYETNNYLYMNNGDGTFQKNREGLIPNDAGSSSQSSIIDFNNDGFLDVFIVKNIPFLYLNDGNGRFKRVLMTGVESLTNHAWGDYDGDGDLDLYVPKSGANLLYVNNIQGANWIQIRAIGTKSNYSGYGTKIKIKSNVHGTTVWQLREISGQIGHQNQNNLFAHFGLGDAGVVDSVKIIWPSGETWDTSQVDINQLIVVRETVDVKANFYSMQTTSTVRPFWVEFTDISIGNNISRRWFFGDGDSSTVTNPNHLYTRSGNFSVSLIVTDGTYSDTLIKPNYVTVDFFTESNISFGTGNPSGIACGDYNSDGNTDVFICNMFEPNLFFRNVSNGIFTSITTGEMVNAIDFNLHCSWGDVNNDNLLDLCITVNDPASSNYLFLNDDTDFVRIAGGDFANDIGYFTSCSWIDYNQDGNLDIFTTNYYEKNCLYRNNGNENFTKVIEGELVNDIDYFEFGSWADYNNDGYSDIFITNSNGNNYLYMNNGDETFTRILSGDIVTDGVFSTRSCWGDFNNDGFMDLFVANYDEVNLLFKNNGNGTFERITVGEIANDRYNSYYGCWGDFDNDGFLDLMVRNLSTPNSLYLNLGNETFNKIYGSVVSNNPENSGMHSAWIDHDNNGFLDLINLSDPYLNNVLYSNLGNNNNWLEIKCRGVYSNSIGIGAKILLKTPINGQENLQYREINSDNYLTAHFGLGDATTVDSIIIKWPSGIVWDTTNVDVNQVLTIREKVPNHPPLIYVLPSLNMQEDTSLELPRQYWYPYVNDPDDPDSNLSFSVMPGSHIRVIQTDTLCTLFPDTNWFGIDSLVFRASDGSSLASKELFCQVQSINDPPEVENLPDTLNFPGDSSISIPLWEYVYDVETPDSLLKYYFNTRNDSLSYSFSDENGLLLISSVHNYSGITHIFITVEDDSSARISDSVTIVVFPPSVITSKEDQIPTRYILYQNFPNPFNSLTSIRFGLPERSKVKIEIYNILGEKVYTLIDEYKPAGYFTLSLNAMNFSSGLYFILMQANKYREFRKILLVK